MNSLNQRVKDLCAKEGITLADLASRMGITASSLSQILNGNPTLAKLQSIASCIGVGMSDLFLDSHTYPMAACPHCGKQIKIKVEI
jgi:transcriptional regulator with XRE-family HTH domain